MREPQQEHSTEVNGVDPPRSPRLRGDDIVGGAILLLCAVVYAITMTFEEVPVMLSQGIQPAAFPRLMIVVIAILAVVMMIQGRRGGRTDRRPLPLAVYGTTGLLILFVVAIDWLGTIIAISLFCLALPVLWGERRYAWLVAFAVLFPMGIFVLFSKVLEVRFPSGVLQLFGS